MKTKKLMGAKLVVKDGVIYAGGSVLGEYEDGRFIPSRFLMEQSVKYQGRVDAFARKHKPRESR